MFIQRNNMTEEEYEYLIQKLRGEIIKNLYKPIILTEQQIDEKLEDGKWHTEYLTLKESE